MFKMIKKADIILFIILVAAGLSLSWISASASVIGEKAVVTVDGNVYGIYSLSENQTVTVEDGDHINKITINEGTVQMSYSTCKNQVCVKDGKISKTNESIVCLPNKVMVEITGGEGDYDAVAK